MSSGAAVIIANDNDVGRACAGVAVKGFPRVKDCINCSVRVNCRANRRTILARPSTRLDSDGLEMRSSGATVKRLIDGGRSSTSSIKVVVPDVNTILSGAGAALHGGRLNVRLIDA